MGSALFGWSGLVRRLWLENWWTKRERYEEFWRCILKTKKYNSSLSMGVYFKLAGI
jgi:hypothetical protein